MSLKLSGRIQCLHRLSDYAWTVTLLTLQVNLKWNLSMGQNRGFAVRAALAPPGGRVSLSLHVLISDFFLLFSVFLWVKDEMVEPYLAADYCHLLQMIDKAAVDATEP